MVDRLLKPIVSNMRRGFTIIEMLVVVVVVAILIAIMVRTIQGVSGTNERAVTIQRLERLKFAIEEYYNEYGQYPPVDSRHVFSDRVDYMFPHPDYASSASAAIGQNDEMAYPLFKFGLMGFLVPRYDFEERYDLGDAGGKGLDKAFFKSSQWSNFNRDKDGNPLIGNGPRDERAWRRWKKFIDDIIKPDRMEFGSNKGGDYLWPVYRGSSSGSDPAYYLQQFTIKDGWDNSIKYKSDPPYTSYKLWSTGGADEDDYSTAARKKWIYGDVGY